MAVMPGAYLRYYLQMPYILVDRRGGLNDPGKTQQMTSCIRSRHRFSTGLIPQCERFATITRGPLAVSSLSLPETSTSYTASSRRAEQVSSTNHPLPPRVSAHAILRAGVLGQSVRRTKPTVACPASSRSSKAWVLSFLALLVHTYKN